MPIHGFPPPWSVVELGEAFAIEDANSQKLAYVYFRNPDSDSQPAALNRLTRDQARWIAANIAKLPTLIEVDRSQTPHDP